MVKSVLVVEDEPNIVLSLEYVIKKAGYEVRVARDGEEALKAVEEAAPDLILLDETSQVLEYSRQLEQKSQALENATAELTAANEQLKELDKLKDEFLSTVTHELRTPLTSVRAFSEILHDNPSLDTEERKRFLGIIIRESERLTRLINQVLDLTKIEAGRMEWRMGEVNLKEVIEDAVATLSHLFEERGSQTGDEPARGGAGGSGRPRPLDAGRDHPVVQCREVLPPLPWPGGGGVERRNRILPRAGRRGLDEHVKPPADAW